MTSVSKQNQRRGIWTVVKDGYEVLVQNVIRPTRANYNVQDLGPSRVLIDGIITNRVDLQLKNVGGFTLECSWWKPEPRKDKNSSGDSGSRRYENPNSLDENEGPRPCVIVLHGNCSCRVGSLDIARYAVPAGFSVFSLDFSGSGHSEGKYVSLGFHEQHDIATAVNYIRRTKEAGKIVLWGRSMGAVASLLYVDKDPTINAMILDSPFSSLQQLATELVDDGKLAVPKVAVKMVMQLMRRDIKRRAKFDMFKLRPIDRVHKCKVPAFYMIGVNDSLVRPEHVQDLYKRHKGPKHLYTFKGGHNSPRPSDGYLQAIEFVRVLIGLLPLETKKQRKVGAYSTIPAPPSTSAPLFSNPLPHGVSIDAVHKMSVTELKAAIRRAGLSDLTCVEKKDMIELVLAISYEYKEHCRQRRPTHR